jgi:hypothetical protein
MGQSCVVPSDPSAARLRPFCRARYPPPAMFLLRPRLGCLCIATAVVALPACRRQPDKLEETLHRIESSIAEERTTGFNDLADLLNGGEVTSEIAERHAARILTVYAARHPRLAEAQSDAPTGCGSWAEAEPYRFVRYEAQLLLDLLGMLGTGESEARLREATALKDRRLRFFGLSGLLRSGRTVDPIAVADVATDDEMRSMLFESLLDHGQSALFPPALHTQEAFARADFVRWLTFPTELGCVPNEVELMKVVASAAGDWFVFRFKATAPEFVDPDVWKAGVAGPYARGAQPTARPGSGTRSDFGLWESYTPEGHLLRLSLGDAGGPSAAGQDAASQSPGAF